jgi:hypothetical protein
MLRYEGEGKMLVSAMACWCSAVQCSGATIEGAGEEKEPGGLAYAVLYGFIATCGRQVLRHSRGWWIEDVVGDVGVSVWM